MEKNRLQYLRRLRYLSIPKKLYTEKAKDYSMLILTFIGFILLSYFAVSPTITTIVQLKKQIDDSKFVNKKLEEKIKNINSLSEQYPLIQQDIILSAIPQSPKITELLAQLQSLAKTNNLRIAKLQTYTVDLVFPKSKTASFEETPSDFFSFAFSFEAEGRTDDVLHLVSQLVNFNRLVSVDTMLLSRKGNENLALGFTGKAYFKK